MRCQGQDATAKMPVPRTSSQGKSWDLTGLVSGYITDAYLLGLEMLLGSAGEVSARDRLCVGVPVMDSAPLSRDDNRGGVSGWITSDMAAAKGPASHSHSHSLSVRTP